MFNNTTTTSTITKFPPTKKQKNDDTVLSEEELSGRVTPTNLNNEGSSEESKVSDSLDKKKSKRYTDSDSGKNLILESPPTIAIEVSNQYNSLYHEESKSPESENKAKKTNKRKLDEENANSQLTQHEDFKPIELLFNDDLKSPAETKENDVSSQEDELLRTIEEIKAKIKNKELAPQTIGSLNNQLLEILAVDQAVTGNNNTTNTGNSSLDTDNNESLKKWDAFNKSMKKYDDNKKLVSSKSHSNTSIKSSSNVTIKTLVKECEEFYDVIAQNVPMIVRGVNSKQYISDFKFLGSLLNNQENKIRKVVNNILNNPFLEYGVNHDKNQEQEKLFKHFQGLVFIIGKLLKTQSSDHFKSLIQIFFNGWSDIEAKWLKYLRNPNLKTLEEKSLDIPADKNVQKKAISNTEYSQDQKNNITECFSYKDLTFLDSFNSTIEKDLRSIDFESINSVIIDFLIFCNFIEETVISQNLLEQYGIANYHKLSESIKIKIENYLSLFSTPELFLELVLNESIEIKFEELFEYCREFVLDIRLVLLDNNTNDSIKDVINNIFKRWYPIEKNWLASLKSSEHIETIDEILRSDSDDSQDEEEEHEPSIPAEQNLDDSQDEEEEHESSIPAEQNLDDSQDEEEEHGPSISARRIIYLDDKEIGYVYYDSQDEEEIGSVYYYSQDDEEGEFESSELEEKISYVTEVNNDISSDLIGYTNPEVSL